MTYNSYAQRKALCDAYHVPYLGPTVDECNDADDYADYQYEMFAQQELDDQWQWENNDGT